MHLLLQTALPRTLISLFCLFLTSSWLYLTFLVYLKIYIFFIIYLFLLFYSHSYLPHSNFPPLHLLFTSLSRANGSLWFTHSPRSGLLSSVSKSVMSLVAYSSTINMERVDSSEMYLSMNRVWVNPKDFNLDVLNMLGINAFCNTIKAYVYYY